MCDLDLERAQVWRTATRRARKPRKCDGCKRTIKAGQKYFYVFMVCDGATSSESGCMPCARAADLFGKDHHMIPTPGYFVEVLEECVAEPEGKKWRPMLRALRARQSQAEAARG